MAKRENIDRGCRNFQLGTRDSGSRRNLDYLLSRRTLRPFGQEIVFKCCSSAATLDAKTKRQLPQTGGSPAEHESKARDRLQPRALSHLRKLFRKLNLRTVARGSNAPRLVATSGGHQ
jgi:hypothetical protein